MLQGEYLFGRIMKNYEKYIIIFGKELGKWFYFANVKY
jgi:hypothetical protein